MKSSFKAIASIAALGIVILLMLHIFLTYGLTKAMRNVVLPRIKEETGIDVQVRRLSLNVPEGLIYLKGIAVRNPEGFEPGNAVSVDTIKVTVDVGSLFRQNPLLVKNAVCDNAWVNVIRNKDGELNFDRLLSAVPQPPENNAAAGGNAPAHSQKNPLPEILIEDLRFPIGLRFFDDRLDQPDLKLSLLLTGDDLTTQTNPDAAWGHLALNGSLDGDNARFITNLDLDVAPVTDPSTPSFDLAGSIREIDPAVMEDAYDTFGFRSAPFELKPAIHCRFGRFVDSCFLLSMKQIRLEDKLSGRKADLGSIDALRFPVPVEGTLLHSTVDVRHSFRRALGGNAPLAFDPFSQGPMDENSESNSE